MTKLNQIIAIEKGIKSRAHSDSSELYKAIQKPALFNGFAKVFEGVDESDTLPPENQKVQFQVNDVLNKLGTSISELLDVTARKDFGNMEANADVKIGEQVIIAKAPVTYLLFLEKQLTDIRTMVAAIPVLDEGEEWKLDTNSGLYKTDPVRTTRTKKVQKPLVLYPATEVHPAQTQIVSEDVIAGYWKTTKLSGAYPKPQVTEMVTRVETLLKAVKTAREAANMFDAKYNTPVGAAVFSYIFEGKL